jgi:hypothetical protein
MSVVYDPTNGLASSGERLPVGHGAVGLVGLAGFADGGVEFGPLLRLVLGLKQVADGAEGVGQLPPPDRAVIVQVGSPASEAAASMQCAGEAAVAGMLADLAEGEAAFDLGQAFSAGSERRLTSGGRGGSPQVLTRGIGAEGFGGCGHAGVPPVSWQQSWQLS